MLNHRLMTDNQLIDYMLLHGTEVEARLATIAADLMDEVAYLENQIEDDGMWA